MYQMTETGIGKEGGGQWSGRKSISHSTLNFTRPWMWHTNKGFHTSANQSVQFHFMGKRLLPKTSHFIV